MDNSQHTPGQVNLTQFTIPQIAEQWGVKVHAFHPPHKGTVWLRSSKPEEVTCKRCIALAAATGSTHE